MAENSVVQIGQRQVAPASLKLDIFSGLEQFELGQRMAKALASSTIVPKQYQNNTGNCLIALEMSSRLGVGPLMVMQNLYIVNGMPSWSSQYIIAMINSSKKYKTELQYHFEGEGPDLSCYAYAEDYNDHQVIGPTISMDMAKKEGWYGKAGSKWQTMPEIMIRYRSASFFGRLNCPDMIMGIYSTEEILDGIVEYQVLDPEEAVKQEIEANSNSQVLDFTKEEPIEHQEDIKKEPATNEPSEAEKQQILAAEQAEAEADYGQPSFESGWVGEREDRPETATGDLEMVRITLHEMYAQPSATQQLIDDPAFNFESYINQRIANRFGRREGYAFINGNGANMPEGLLVSDQVGIITDTLDFDALIQLQAELRQEFAINANFMFNRFTLAYIRTLKDANGQYVWQPSTQVDKPNMILGDTYVIADDMPNAASAGTLVTGATPILYGDFSAYRIVDKKGISTLRDPYTKKPHVLFYTTKQVGGQVINDQAIKKLKLS